MRLVVLSNINSGQYVAGDQFEADEALAQELIEAGAAREFTEADTVEVSDEAPVEPPADPEAPATDSPLVPEQPVVSDSPESQVPVEPPQDPSTPAQQPEAPQPTAAQIEQDLQAAGEGSPQSGPLQIS